jgi:hypothetical protein
MAYYALFYDYAEDYMARRQAFRPEHLALAEQARRDGRLVMAGALQPPDTALFVFRTDGPRDVEEFARSDPYVKNGVAKAWRVREWTVVVGG